MSPIIIAIISSGLLSTVVSSLFSIWKDSKKKNSKSEEAIQVLLYDRIKEKCKVAIERGYTTHEELEDITRMYRCYDIENDSGYLNGLMSAIQKQPINGEFK